MGLGVAPRESERQQTMTPGAEPDNLRTPVPPLVPSIPHADSAKVAELVDDGGLGLAADLAAGALAVAGVPEGRCPWPWTVNNAATSQGPHCSRDQP